MSVCLGARAWPTGVSVWAPPPAWHTAVFVRAHARTGNLVLPADQRVSWHPPRAKSFGQLVSKSHILAHYLQLVDQHRDYPSSSLPKALGIAIAGSVVGFIGTI